MELDRKTCYRALETRDSRFDGRFFTGVLSTGIYCRPICPATTPREENCVFLPSAAAARDSGFRPCLRCRPEASPGTPAWAGTSATVSRALRLIDGGALDAASVSDLALSLGLGDRHLRRLFLKHLGATPVAVAQTRRIHFAKRLIDETSMAMAEIALSSGFSSVRRFNDAFAKTYGRPPTGIRRQAGGPENAGVNAGANAGAGLTLRLPYRPPYPWGRVAAYLGARAIPGVEAVDGGGYRRTIRIDGTVGWVHVAPGPTGNFLNARLFLSDTTALIRVVERLRAVFDLDADPQGIASRFTGDPVLGREARRAVRVPGAWDGFELGVRAILGQQITVKGATTLSGRLAAAFGTPFGGGGALSYLFPSAQTLAAADLSGLGLTAARARAIKAFAAAVADRTIVLDGTGEAGETARRIAALPGLGPWTAQYIAMRALREPDAFPDSDLGLRRAAAEGEAPLGARELHRLAEAWRPWRAYGAMLLWTKKEARP